MGRRGGRTNLNVFYKLIRCYIDRGHFREITLRNTNFHVSLPLPLLSVAGVMDEEAKKRRAMEETEVEIKTEVKPEVRFNVQFHGCVQKCRGKYSRCLWYLSLSCADGPLITSTESYL
jgi:hypothetical protein